MDKMGNCCLYVTSLVLLSIAIDPVMTCRNDESIAWSSEVRKSSEGVPIHMYTVTNVVVISESLYLAQFWVSIKWSPLFVTFKNSQRSCFNWHSVTVRDQVTSIDFLVIHCSVLLSTILRRCTVQIQVEMDCWMYFFLTLASTKL